MVGGKFAAWKKENVKPPLIAFAISVSDDDSEEAAEAIGRFAATMRETYADKNDPE